MASQFTAVVLLAILSSVLSTDTDPCFTDIYLSDLVETITSPGYPDSYPSFVFCGWRIHAQSPDHLVGVNYYASLEKSYYCRTGTLSFYDGGPHDSTDMLLQLCGSYPKLGSIISNGPTMYVYLITGHASGGNGFLLNVTDVERCDGSLTATSEERNITSLDLTQSYFSNQKCTWVITAENENETVKVTNQFLKEGHFSTECKHDVVRVYDGNTSKSDQIPGELCSNVERTYYSSGNALTVVFEKLSSEGVRLQYTEVPESDCNRTYYILDDPVHIQSPGYPDSYGSNLNCVIFIFDLMTTPNIKLDVVHADIEGDYPHCDKDSVTLFGGNNGSHLPVGTFCGNSSISPVGPYYSNGRSMKLVFKSNSDISGKGFQVDVSHTSRQDNTNVIVILWYCQMSDKSCSLVVSDVLAILQHPTASFNDIVIWDEDNVVFKLHMVPDQSENCGPRLQTATTHPKFLSSPGYPVLSPSTSVVVWNNSTHDALVCCSNADCIWIIKASDPNMMVRIDVVNSDIQYDPIWHRHCGQNLGLVYDGPSMFDTFLLSWCGKDLPSLQSNGSAVTVRFKARDAYNMTGIRFKYFATNEPWRCGGTIELAMDEERTLKAPYRSSQDCLWTIHVPTNANIKVHVDAILFIASCHDNYLEIYDGNYDNSTTHGRWCGDYSSDFISSGNIITARFFFNKHNSGLKMIIKAGHFDASEKTTLSASSRPHYLNSPNYPFNYPSNVESAWKIEANEGSRVSFGVTFSRLEKSDGCQRDYMEAFDGSDSSAPSLGRWCGSSEPRKTASSSVMFLIFKSNSHTVDRGFSIMLSAFRYTTESPAITGTQKQDVIVGASVGAAVLLLIIVGAMCGIVCKRSIISRKTDASTKEWTMDQNPENANIPRVTFFGDVPQSNKA